MKSSVQLLVIVIALALSQASLAADDPLTSPTSPTSIETVQARIDALQKELDALKQAQQKKTAPAQEQPRVTFNGNRAAITSANGDSSIAVRALVQADAAMYDQATAGPLISDYRRGSVGGATNRENTAARDLSSGIYFRRARFGLEGTIARDFGYRLMVELGGAGTEGQGRINDAWLSYSGFAPFTLQIGAFSPASNLDDSTGVDATDFLERATPSELSRTLGGADGRIGVGIRGNGDRWMSALTLTSRTVIDPEVFDSQVALVGRAGFQILTNADYTLHLGASGTYVMHPADQGIDASGARKFVRFRERPELRVDSTRLIDTGNIDANHAYVVGAELAGNWRSLFAQAENFWFGVDRNSSLSDPHFGGYYIQSTWTITGEAHRYNKATASYQSPKPARPYDARGGIGAWELALRYSHMDLNFESGDAGTAPSINAIRGGVQDIRTFGVNWYLSQSLRFTLDYQLVDIDRLNPAGPGNAAPFGATPATPPVGAQIGQHYNAVSLRSQFSF